MTKILKSEGKQKASLKKEMELVLPRFVIISHIDSLNGIPDWSVTGNKVTSWLEFKSATPAFTSRGIQVLTARRLAAVGFCRYVIFWEDGKSKRTCIVHPRNVSFGHNPTTAPELFCDGHDNQFVIAYIRTIHEML